MGQRSRANLKNSFKTGDKPTQANFEDLIDSQYNKVDDVGFLMSTSDKAKLDGIETGAEVNPTSGEIETAYNARVSKVSAGEIAAGTETNVRRFSPNDVKEIAEAHGGEAAVAAHINKTTDAHDSANIEHTGTYNEDKVVRWILDHLQEHVSSLWQNVTQQNGDIQSLDNQVENLIDTLPNIERVSISRSKVNGQAYVTEQSIEGDGTIEIDLDVSNFTRIQVVCPELLVGTINGVNGSSYIFVFFAAEDTVISFSEDFVDLDPIELNESEEIIVSGVRTNNHFLMKASGVFNAAEHNAPILASILIDDGDESCISQSVLVSLNRTGGNVPSHYRISESPNFTGADWVMYVSDTISLSLSSGEGEKTVYVQLKDNANSESDVKWDKIIYVVNAPVINSVTLKDRTDNNTVTTDEATVKIVVSLSTSGLLMQIRSSESSSFADDPSWVSWNGVTEIEHTFDDPETTGTKTVYVQVQNVKSSSPSQGSDSIDYQTLDPVTIESFTLNGGVGTTTSRTIEVAFTTDNDPDEYRLSEDENFDGVSWNTISSEVVFELGWGNELKTVYLQVRRLSDGSIATSDPPATVTLNLAAPSITSFSLDNGASSTSDEVVTLNFATSGSPDEYKVSEDEGFSGASWFTISGTPNFTLSPGDGTKTVHLKVRRNDSTKDGQESSSSPDTITLSISDPDLSITSLTDHGDQTVDIVMSNPNGTAKTFKVLDVVHSGSAPSSGDWDNAPSHNWSTTHNYAVADTGNRDIYIRVFNYSSEYYTGMSAVEVAAAVSDIDLADYIMEGGATLSKPSGFPTSAEGFCFLAGEETALLILHKASSTHTLYKYLTATNAMASDFSASLSGFNYPFGIAHKSGNQYIILDIFTSDGDPRYWIFDLVEVTIQPSTTGQTITKSGGTSTRVDPSNLTAYGNNTYGLDYDKYTGLAILASSRATSSYNRGPYKYDFSANACSAYDGKADGWWATNVPIPTSYYLYGVTLDPVSRNLLMVIDNDSAADARVAVWNGSVIGTTQLKEDDGHFSGAAKLRDVLITADRSKLYLLSKGEGVFIFTKNS